MGEITDIKEQAKRTERVSIYVDGTYKFSLAKDQAAHMGLHIGQQLEASEIDKLKEDSQFGKLRDNTFKWISLRPRSENEIQQYLRRKTDDEALRERVINMLNDLGYVDDEKFARSWIQHRILLKPISKLRLKQELLQKRVSMPIIDSLLDETELDELESVKQIIVKRGHRYDDRQKLMAYLARQGFSYDVIKKALTEQDGS